MRISEVVVQAGTPELALCATCNTNSHVSVVFYILGSDGPSSLGASSGCGHCGTGFFADNEPSPE